MIWQLLVCSGSIATNVFGLGEVERQPVRWENCAKPVLAVVYCSEIKI